MALPVFYIEVVDAGNKMLTLNEETSKHVIQVLRMKVEDRLQLTDGKGNILLSEITNDNRKKTGVKIIEHKYIPLPGKKITLAVSLVKNNSRFEWFLEKATELGIHEIVPLICERTEKQHFRLDRMKGILISAMLQSQQAWLPILHEPIRFADFIKNSNASQKFIGYCDEGTSKHSLTTFRPFTNASMLIGPEGDFSYTEIAMALENNFIPVSLGSTRLRTETAAIAAAVLLQMD